MPGAASAEIIFIAAMMILILILSFSAVFFFVKTYRKEMRQKEARKASMAARTGSDPTDNNSQDD